MTRTDESLGGSLKRARISSAEAQLFSAKIAWMISRSRRVRCCGFRFAIGPRGNATDVASYCDICRMSTRRAARHGYEARSRRGPVGGHPWGIVPAPCRAGCVGTFALGSGRKPGADAVIFCVFQSSVNESNGAFGVGPESGHAKYSQVNVSASTDTRQKPPSTSLYASKRTPCTSVSNAAVIGALL